MNRWETTNLFDKLHSLAKDELNKGTPQSLQRSVRIINIIQELRLISSEIEEEGDDE